uniref:Ly6/PLAUR domain-containing protein 1-like n=2 Tax=Denticeps clupeoides TaxID=299321 RepID=A0AAY4CZE5_9TELE
MWLLFRAALLVVSMRTGVPLQIQCYQCEELKHNDCSTPEYIVNCTVNVQDTCQREVLVMEDGEPFMVQRTLTQIFSVIPCFEVPFWNILMAGFLGSSHPNLRTPLWASGLIKDRIHYRKSCASSGACLIASSGYQQFCTGKLHSVCITCCNTPLCNGPKQKRPVPSTAPPPDPLPAAIFLTVLLLPLT